MQTIETSQRNMLSLTLSYGITLAQRSGAFKVRKAVFVNAIKRNPCPAINILGATTNICKAFDECHDGLFAEVDRQAIQIIAGCDSDAQSGTVMRYYADAKKTILATYRISSHDYIQLLDAITANPEYMDKIEYPSWMNLDKECPIASFMVLHRVRNLLAHPESLDHLLSYNLALKKMYDNIKQETVEKDWVFPSIEDNNGAIPVAVFVSPESIKVGNVSEVVTPEKVYSVLIDTQYDSFAKAATEYQKCSKRLDTYNRGVEQLLTELDF